MKNLCSGTHRGGFQFLLILDLWVISFHAVVVFDLGRNILFKSILGHWNTIFIMSNKLNLFAKFGWIRLLVKTKKDFLLCIILEAFQSGELKDLREKLGKLFCLSKVNGTCYPCRQKGRKKSLSWFPNFFLPRILAREMMPKLEPNFL